jgi:hypothetical protein
MLEIPTFSNVWENQGIYKMTISDCLCYVLATGQTLGTVRLAQCIAEVE